MLGPQNSSQLGLIYTLDRVCNPYGNPGTDGSHQGTECRVTVPGTQPGYPSHPQSPSPVLSHSGYCCCWGHQLHAAVEQLNTNATRQPDLGLSVVCTPNPLVEHGIPTETRLGDTASCTTPKGWALTPMGPLWSDGMGGAFPLTMQAGSSEMHFTNLLRKSLDRAPVAPHAACTVTRPALLSHLLCLSLHPTLVLSTSQITGK